MKENDVFNTPQNFRREITSGDARYVQMMRISPACFASASVLANGGNCGAVTRYSSLHFDSR